MSTCLKTVGSTPFTVSLQATDAENHALTWSLAVAAEHGDATVTGSGTSPSVAYVPAADFSGADQFVVQVTDAFGASDQIAVAVTVTPVNDAPTIAGDNVRSVSIDMSSQTVPLGLALTATDVDGDTLTWSVSSSSLGTPVLATPSVSRTTSTVEISLTPTASGTDTLIVSVDDGAGTSASVAIELTVVPAAAEPLSTWCHQACQPSCIVAAPSADLGTWQSQNDGASLQYAYVWSVADNDTGANRADVASSETYTPALADFGRYLRLSVTASDIGGSTTAHSDWVAISSSTPTIAAGSSAAVTMSEDSEPVGFALTITASDRDGDQMTWSVSTAASNGSATVDANGDGTNPLVDYTPAENFAGTDTFTLTVRDDDDNSASIIIDVTVSAQPDAPVNTATALPTRASSVLNSLLPQLHGMIQITARRFSREPINGNSARTETRQRPPTSRCQ